MLSVASGHDVGYLLGPVAGGRESYYTGAGAAGEPPGVWHGAGAELLGLRGVVDAEVMEAVYSHLLDPRDPASASPATWGEADRLGKEHKTYRSAKEVYAAALEREPAAGPERRAELRAEADRSARSAVSFLDVTFSAPKSISVLGVAFERMAADARAVGDEEAAAAWDAHVRAVEEAVMAGARAAVDYLQDRAGYARVGHHGGGAGQWIDAHRFVVAQFLQHDSRDGDPQLHVHQAILNRVLCADGLWRALDGQALYQWKAAAGAVAERVTEAMLAASLGVRVQTRPDGKAREVVGVGQELRELFSSRRRATTAKAGELLVAFAERVGRDPSALERWRICQQATLATRKAKSHNGETRAQQMDRWARECKAAVIGGLAQVARQVVARAQQPGPPAQWSEGDVIERALVTLEGSRGKWTYSDALRAVSDALPGHLGIAADDVVALAEGLTDRLVARVQRLTAEEDTSDLPPGYVLDNGESSFARPGSALYATPRQVAGEHALRRAAVRRGAAAFTAQQAEAVVTRFATSGHELGADQAAVVRGVLASGAAVEVVAAAAGTGKSFTVGALREVWEASGRRVFGLAPSQVAAHVLIEEGLTARNVADWLGLQRRLNEGRPGEDEALRLRFGDLVVVDEAGMTSTPDLVAVHQRCQGAGAKLLLVGDPRQLAAVGAGGAMADVAAHGVRYELAEVRRFTAGWERAASLRLRDGDPSALDEYTKHGRLVDGGTAEQAEAAAARAWLADVIAGRESLLLVGSNEAAARASAKLRADLVALGRVAEAGVELARQGTVAGVGDLVQARRNGWELLGVEGNTTAPINRACYRVSETREDGGLVVEPALGGSRITLPAGYVAEHVTLGYASTVHAAQGRTVDTAHAVIGGGTDAAGAYVAMTRGRERNTAWAVTTAVGNDAPVGAAHDAPRRTARSVLADVLEHAGQERSALAEAEESERDAASTRTHGDRLIEVVARVTAGRTSAALDRLVADGLLSEVDRRALAADDGMDAVDRLLRTAEVGGLDRTAVLTEAVVSRDFSGARSPAQVLYGRVSGLLAEQPPPTVATYADLIPAGLPENTRTFLRNRADAADQRRRQLGADTAQTCPQWAREALGPVPADPIAGAEWEHAAGWAASWRELAEHVEEADPLGAAPPTGLVDKLAVWRTAHAALDLPDSSADEHERSDGQLRARVRAFEREEAWAPRYVGDELDATEKAAARARTNGQLWAARAETVEDTADAEQLRADAATARAEVTALTERIAALEDADTARARWYAATAVTRDAAHRARSALQDRGVNLDDDQRVTAQEWLDAHRAEQAAEDPHREVRDQSELVPDIDDDVVTDADEHQLETDVPDIRETAVAEETEHTDPAQQHRVPDVDETAAAVTRAQEALAEIEARRQADATREAEEQCQTVRREALARWTADDQAAEQGAVDERDDDLVLEC